MKKNNHFSPGMRRTPCLRYKSNPLKRSASVRGVVKTKILPNICCQIMHLCISYSNETGFTHCAMVKLKFNGFNGFYCAQFLRGNVLRLWIFIFKISHINNKSCLGWHGLGFPLSWDFSNFQVPGLLDFFSPAQCYVLRLRWRFLKFSNVSKIDKNDFNM